MSGAYNAGFRGFRYALKSGGTYSRPALLRGAMKISFKPQTAGRALLCRLDDGSVRNVNSMRDNGITASVAVADLPDDFKINVLGYVRASDGSLYEGRQEEVHFALLYETQGKTEPTRHMLLDCVCTKAAYDANTKSNTPAIDARSLELILNPEKDDSYVLSPISYGKYRREIKQSQNAQLYDTWFGLET